MGVLIKVFRILIALAVLAALAFAILVVTGVFTALDSATLAYASCGLEFTC